MSVPRRFVGAWEREGLAIAGVPVAGIGRALWIESGGIYVDVRALGTAAGGTSFGGRSSWRSPRYTWHHDLDLDPRPGRLDRGELHCAGDTIVERGIGIGGDPAPYEERWRRAGTAHPVANPTANVMVAIARHDHGLAVRVGDHAGVVVAPPAGRGGYARAWVYRNERWDEAITLGTTGTGPEPRAADWHLPPGWHSS